MVLLALAPLLLLGTALSDAESLALTFVKRLEAAQLLDGVLPEAPTLTSNELRPNVVSVRVAERYSVAVDLPVRQVYGFTDLDLARSETGTIQEGWDEEAYGRRVRLVHAATGAPGEVSRVIRLRGLDDASSTSVRGNARIGFGGRLIAVGPYYEFDRRTGRLRRYLTDTIPTPQPQENLRDFATVVGPAGSAALRFREGTGRATSWDVLSTVPGPFEQSAVYARPGSALGAEPLPEPYATLSRIYRGIPAYLVRFASVNPETGLGGEYPVCEVLVDAANGTVISVGVVPGGGPNGTGLTTRWRDAMYRTVETATGRRKITGPSLGPETPAKADDAEIACALVGDGLIVRAFYRPGTRTVRVGKLVLRAGAGLVAAMKTSAK